MKRAILWSAATFLALRLPAAAQSVPDTARGWNSLAASELLARARARREQPRGDTALRNYSARAAGHIYFYLDDRDNADKRTLVKVDQVALELHWAAPNRTKQRIVGLRDESRLPNRMRYHLDHLTVVQNGFGDIIRLGDGDEVRDVPHPAAAGSDTIYDFRLGDSLTLNFVGQPPVRVYEVHVRPRRNDRSALIGSIFIDEASADIVRMTFTFTPASYVDRRLDYINISLDNGLWSGRYWLPNEQFVEIRRQIPELDFVAGAVIKGRLRVYDYRFNQELPRELFFGAPVEASPTAQREKFAFDEPLYAGLDREGLTSPPQIDVLRKQALELIRRQKLSGLPKVRLHIPNASSVFRFNRAEGAYFGAGLSYVPVGSLRYDGSFGYAEGAAQGAASLTMRYKPSAQGHIALRAFANDLRDIGWRPGLPGALNTLSSALAGDDYLDPYYATGAALEFLKPIGATWRLQMRGTFEAQRSARLEALDALIGNSLFRPVRPVERGTLTSLHASFGGALLERERYDLNASLGLEAGLWQGDGFLRPTAELGLAYTSSSRKTTAALQASGGFVSARAPDQMLFLLGGYGSIPGYSYRNLTGDSFWLLEAEVSRQILGPWIRLRATGAYGGVHRPNPLPEFWPGSRTHGSSVGLGMGFIYDIIRFDLVRGGSNSPRVIFSVKPDFRGML
jgi:hypothetical protein